MRESDQQRPNGADARKPIGCESIIIAAYVWLVVFAVGLVIVLMT
ncbi:hypothetical protein [Bradyrhizobium uaiense]|nr:hypothetical protein [Bradyrhizobium uaiense]